MPTFKLPNDAGYTQQDGERAFSAIKKASFDLFNPSVLGLGDIESDSFARTAIAAVFDLQGFTVFCKQIEPHLAVPIYLSGFLNWIFAAIRTETTQRQYRDGVKVWHDLPFFTKFMGDGLLVLWDATSMSQTWQHNLILSCANILGFYRTDFLPKMRRKVADVPPALRCGIAKGTVFSVGNGEDYVGSCINVATRLQKLAALPIAFARRGFDPEASWDAPGLARWLLKVVSIRGIGQSELVYVKKADFEALAKEDQAIFRDP